MKKILTLIALGAINFMVANAQVIDIAGLSPHSHPTKAQVEAKFGKPTSYKADKSYYYFTDDEEGRKVYGVLEIYKYPDMEINITTDEGLDYFEVYSKDYPVLTSSVSAGGVRVGQKASVLSRYHLKGEKSIDFTTDYSRQIGADWYYYNSTTNPFDSTFIVLIKDGIIYGFMFTACTSI